LPRGLPASYIKKAKRELGKGASWHDVFKRAWELYKGSKVHKAVSGNPNSKKSSRTKKSKRKGGVRMTKKKRKYRRTVTIPMAPILGLVGAEDFRMMIQRAFEGNWNGVGYHGKSFIGVNPTNNKFDFELFAKNWTPIIVGLLVHKFVGGSPLNLNRTLARHRIPLIRI